MKNVLCGVFFSIVTCGVGILPVQAAVPILYTNENFFTSLHDTPVSPVQDALGNFSGLTETGKLFTQRSVVSDIQVRLHCFAIDEAFFYVSTLGIIVAENDVTALSIYLAQMKWEETV